MKRAFTLLELLTVVAIMGILGSAAVGGYQAITRGMTERAALDATRNLCELAWRRARIDRCNTYVFLFTEVLSADTDDDVANVAGLAVAVKGIGRASAVDGSDTFYDEFGDLDQAFRLFDDENDAMDEDDYEKASSRFRLYNLNSKDFAIVRNGIMTEIREPDLEESNDSGGGGSGVKGANAAPTASNRADRKFRIFGYKKIEGKATFKAGEEFGREFAAIKLPPGFTFEKGKSSYGDSDVKDGLVKISGNHCHVFDENASKWHPKVWRREPSGAFTELRE